MLYIEYYIVEIWLFWGIAFILFEIAAAPSIGFLFAGMAALSVGGLLNYGILLEPNGYIWQFTCFFALTFLFTMLLWAPFKKFLVRHDMHNFRNIVGDMAVLKTDIKGKRGDFIVRWSGANMQARFVDVVPDDISLKKGEKLVIVGIDTGGVFLVKRLEDKALW